MAKRSKVGTKKVPKRKTANSIDLLRKMLSKQTKAELLRLVVGLAKDDRSLQRTLEAQFKVEAPAINLVAATRQAIVDATDFDELRMNYNFDYDYQAYETVKRNLKRLINDGQWTETMELSVELMKSGSYQVEMSDEGLMTDDIEECLRPVIKAIRKSGMTTKEVSDWCSTMLKQDRVGFICDTELKALTR